MIMLTLKTDLQYYKNWITARQNKTKQKHMLFILDAVYVEILLRAFILVYTFFKSFFSQSDRCYVFEHLSVYFLKTAKIPVYGNIALFVQK